ncbi:MAG TPA: hypothetical protein VGB77_22245 [Abditibacteriaceae bacterium]|jgi:hypothetical protein
MTFLFGVTPIDVKEPLSQFQHTRFNPDDVQKLVFTLHAHLEEKAVKPEILTGLFDKFWPDLEKNINLVLNSQVKSEIVHRSDRDMLEESLAILRNMQSRTSRGQIEQRHERQNAALRHFLNNAIELLTPLSDKNNMDAQALNTISQAIENIKRAEAKIEFSLLKQQKLNFGDDYKESE